MEALLRCLGYAKIDTPDLARESSGGTARATGAAQRGLDDELPAGEMLAAGHADSPDSAWATQDRRALPLHTPQPAQPPGSPAAPGIAARRRPQALLPLERAATELVLPALTGEAWKPPEPHTQCTTEVTTTAAGPRNAGMPVSTGMEAILDPPAQCVITDDDTDVDELTEPDPIPMPGAAPWAMPAPANHAAPLPMPPRTTPRAPLRAMPMPPAPANPSPESPARAQPESPPSRRHQREALAEILAVSKPRVRTPLRRG